LVLETKTLKEIQETDIHFLIGLPRSGSTLLATMLGSHPQIFSSIEEPFAHELFAKYKEIKLWTRNTIKSFCSDFYLFAHNRVPGQLPSLFVLMRRLLRHKDNLDFDLAVRIVYFSMFTEQSKKNVDCIIDKELVLHPYMGDVANEFPSSKFIVLTRNPWDNMGRWRELIRARIGADVSISELATKWMYRYRLITSQLAKIDATRYLFVKYEELICNPESTLKGICQFLDKPYDSIMMEYPSRMKLVFDEAKPDFLNAHKGIFKAPDQQEIGKWRQDLTPNEAIMVARICGKTAKKLGYSIPNEIQKKNGAFKELVAVRVDRKLILKKKIVFGLWGRMPFRLKRWWKKLRKLQS
jgi:hypothetical protein